MIRVKVVPITLVWAVTATWCCGQTTRVDLRTQGKSVDFSGAVSTKPSKTGTSLPASCSPGETFFKTDAVPGKNIYACTAANVWTLQGGSDGATALTAASAIGMGAMAVGADGTRGMEASALTGVLKASSGVPAAVTGVASDCVKVDGSSGACGGSSGAVDSLDLTDLAISKASGTRLDFAAGQYGSGADVYSLLAGYFTIRSFSATGVSTANPAVITIGAGGLSGVLHNGDTVTIAGVTGTGCSGINTTATVAGFNNTELTLTGVSGVGCTYSSGGTMTGTGNGTAYVYGNASGSITLEVPAASGVIAACTSGSCVVNQVVTPAFTADVIPLATATVASGAWGTVTDKRSFLGGRPVSAGTGIAVSVGGMVSIDTATVPQLSGTNVWTGTNDLSGAARTASFKASTTAPGTCTLGDTFFDTDATAGSNFLGCTSSNTWTVQGSGLATAMSQSTENSTANTVSVSVGTSGRAFAKTPVTIDPTTGAISTPGGVASTSAGGVAGHFGFGQGTAYSADANTVHFQAPTSVTGYGITLPGAYTAGVVHRTAANPSVESVSAVAVADVAAILKTRSHTFVITGSGTAGVLQNTDDQPAVWYNSLGQGVTITSVSCKTDSSTASRIQLQRDDGSPANILTDNAGAGLDCSSTRASGTLVGTEKAIASTQGIDFVMVSAGGVGKWVSVTITYTLD